MIGNGVEIIIDPMTFNKFFLKLDKGKGIVMVLSKQEIDENKTERTGIIWIV